MKIVEVTFRGNNKPYQYFTNLNLVVGNTYWIVADGRVEYSSPVTVQKICTHSGLGNLTLRYITEAARVNTNSVLGTTEKTTELPRLNLIKKVYYNEKKGVTTVLWTDGTPPTMISRHPEDPYDGEKAIAMAFMKKAYGNRGCFNEELKKFCINLEERIDNK